MLFGLPFALLGLFAFLFLFSDHERQFHGDIFTKIPLLIVSIMFFLGGIFFMFSDRITKDDKSKKDISYKRKPNLKPKIFSFLLFSLVIYSFLFLNNWDLGRLQAYINDEIYVELPDSFYSYDQIGVQSFSFSFYQYKPSLIGNHKKTTIELDKDQYQITLQALDSQQSVSIINQKLNIQTAGNHLVKINIQDSDLSPYHIKNRSSFDQKGQIFFLHQNKQTSEWISVPEEKTPPYLKRRIAISTQYSSYFNTNSFAEIDGIYYLNLSSAYSVRGKGQTYYQRFYKIPTDVSEMNMEREKILWKPIPEKVHHNFMHNHQGNIYSFGGLQHNSKEQNNWMYILKQNEWLTLSETPVHGEHQYNTQIKAVYTVDDKLFVIVRSQDYALYQFDLKAKKQWNLIREFTLPVEYSSWRYLDDKTLFAYKVNTSRGVQSGIVNGYIQTLDLDTFEVKTLTIPPDLNIKHESSILNPRNYDLNVFSYKQSLYAYYAGKLYRLVER